MVQNVAFETPPGTPGCRSVAMVVPFDVTVLQTLVG